MHPFRLIKTEDGFVMGEGAGVVVLEELEHAKQRGASNSMQRLSDMVQLQMHITYTSPAEDGSGAAEQWKLPWKKRC